MKWILRFFTKKKRDDRAALRKAAFTMRYPYVATGGIIRESENLKEKLMANRARQHNGRGTVYWESVMNVIEQHLRQEYLANQRRSMSKEEAHEYIESMAN